MIKYPYFNCVKEMYNFFFTYRHKNHLIKKLFFAYQIKNNIACFILKIGQKQNFCERLGFFFVTYDPAFPKNPQKYFLMRDPVCISYHRLRGNTIGKNIIGTTKLGYNYCANKLFIFPLMLLVKLSFLFFFASFFGIIFLLLF